jgi:hypothetical protein
VERAWWLRRFDDDTIAGLAAAAFGIGDPGAVRSWREHLAGNLADGRRNRDRQRR